MLDPLTEGEMIRFSSPVKVHRAKTSTGLVFVYWNCYCGSLCRIAEKALHTGAVGGMCQCGRDWNLDRVDMSAIVVESADPSLYKFPLIIDRGASWRVHRKASVGIHYENL